MQKAKGCRHVEKVCGSYVFYFQSVSVMLDSLDLDPAHHQ